MFILLSAVLFVLVEGYQNVSEHQYSPHRYSNNSVQQITEYAYVTLLYGDDFLLGVRVLGQSLKESRTKYDRVIVVAGQVNSYTLKTLELDGWRIVNVDIIQNPAKGPKKDAYPPRFWGVFSKLTIFNMTQYKKIVYIDADAVVVQNMDEIFDCPGFCASLRHSERFNSGVMKLDPSAELFESMTQQLQYLPSYTGGDQGFLNSYFTEFKNGLVFDPKNVTDNQEQQQQFMRLPTGYNADIGLYVVNSNRWMISTGDLKVVHYTFGIFKPWDWYTSWLMDEAVRWQAYRDRLPPDAAGVSHGVTSAQTFAQRWLFVFPLFGLLLFRYMFPILSLRDVKSPCSSFLTSILPSNNGKRNVSIIFPAFSIFAGYFSLFFGLLFVIVVIPGEVWPAWGWVLAYEWCILIMVMVFGKYLEWCFLWGRKNSKSLGGSAWTNKSPQRTSLIQTVCLGIFLIVAPWMWYVFAVKSFIGKIICTIIVGLIANTCLTHYFVSLAQAWYNFGKSEGLDSERV